MWTIPAGVLERPEALSADCLARLEQHRRVRESPRVERAVLSTLRELLPLAHDEALHTGADLESLMRMTINVPVVWAWERFQQISPPAPRGSPFVLLGGRGKAEKAVGGDTAFRSLHDATNCCVVRQQ